MDFLHVLPEPHRGGKRLVTYRALEDVGLVFVVDVGDVSQKGGTGGKCLATLRTVTSLGLFLFIHYLVLVRMESLLMVN